MTKILYYATILLCIGSVVFSLVNMGLNIFTGDVDIEPRNKYLLNTIKDSWNLSLLLALFTCLFATPHNVSAAIKQASELYTIIAKGSLGVMLIGGVAMLRTIFTKSGFREDASAAIKNVISVALWAFLWGIVLAWLLS